MTEKLYDTDAYLSEFSATVVDCISAQDGYDIVLDRTAFFPEGGGQSGDVGSLGGTPVIDTQIRDGVIYHRTSGPLSAGSTVKGVLDWGERFRRMQNHSGEHIVSGIVHSRLGFENVGFHLGETEMTMDYDGVLTSVDLKRVEEEANRSVWENRTIHCFYPSEEELNSLEYRSKKDLTEAVRIVTVDGIDTCACCAPHVKQTGEIGGIYIVGSMHWKGGTRLTVRCGSDALKEYSLLREDEKSLSALFSAPRGEIFPAVEKLHQEYADLRRRYHTALKENALMRLEQIPFTEGNLCFLSPCGDGEVMRAAANEGLKKCSGVFVCLFGNDTGGYRYVITSQASGLLEKAKRFNEALSGRGGGSDGMIQGSFACKEETIRDFFKEFNL